VHISLNNIVTEIQLIYCMLIYVNGNKMDQGEPGVDYNDNNLNPLICDLCKKTFDSIDKLGEHQKLEHDM
jgi:hypothetical protein